MTNVLISALELAQQLQQAKKPFIFDVRHHLTDHQAGRQAYQKGHIPGAIFLDHETQLSAEKTGFNGRHPLPNLKDFTALIASYGVTPDDPIVVYDAANSMFASHLWWMLRGASCTHVQVLNGGFAAWQAVGGMQESGDPVLPTVQTVSPTQLKAWLQREPLVAKVDADDVLLNLGKKTHLVIDARAPERFRGDVEPMDKVGGHIPNAVNFPFTQNIDEKGFFKSPQQLKAQFEQAFKGYPSDKIISQCGSGISACHNLLAMEIAGLKGAKLYPGSWSEWCSDPSRPVAKGA